LFEIEDKIPNSVDVCSKIHDKNLKRIQNKFLTKIANFNKSNNSNNSTNL